MADDISRAKDLFVWNRRVLIFYGVWPLQPTYVKFTLWIVYFFIQLTMEFADFYYAFGNLQLVVLNLSESGLETMTIVKMFVLRFSEKLVKLMRRIIDGVDNENYESAEEMKIYMNYNRLAHKFFRFSLIMAIAASTVYHVKPLEFRLKAVLQNESLPFLLPYRTRLCFDVNDSSTFWLVWIYQSPMICLNMFHTVSIGYLFSLALHVSGQLAVLSFRIRNLDFASWENHESSRTVFRDIVVRHRNILGIAKDINAVFGLLLLEELAITTVLLGLTTYSVLAVCRNMNSDDTGMFVSFLLYGTTMLFLIYGCCIAGEYLMTESIKLYEAYYQCQWCEMSVSFKKGLIICMIGASKPLQLTAGGFYIFSLAGFTSILKTAAGYISMLRTMI